MPYPNCRSECFYVQYFLLPVLLFVLLFHILLLFHKPTNMLRISFLLFIVIYLFGYITSWSSSPCLFYYTLLLIEATPSYLTIPYFLFNLQILSYSNFGRFRHVTELHHLSSFHSSLSRSITPCSVRSGNLYFPSILTKFSSLLSYVPYELFLQVFLLYPFFILPVSFRRNLLDSGIVLLN